MRIVDIREVAVPLKTSMRNAAFDFSEMTTSVVAVLTDVVREGRPVVGYAFSLQIDVPQSYGIVQFSRTLKMLERHGWKRESIFPLMRQAASA